MLIRA